MSTSPTTQDLILLDRFLDGELSDEQRAALQQRLLAEPALRSGLEERTRLRSAFAADAGPGFRPRSGFADRVLAASRRLPVESSGEGEAAVVQFCRRILLVAAAVFAAAMLWQSGMFGSGGEGSLQAAPDEAQRIVDELDARIRDRAEPGARR